VIRELPDTTLVRPLTPVPNGFKLKEFMYEYFQLQYSLKGLYQEWSQEDQRLATIAQCIPGVRMVDQDPWECLISFICSSNNNIPRISKMLSAIRMQYGEPLLTIGGDTFYSFPSLEQLSKASDAELRASGMGYRAKYIMETMHILQGHGGESYLRELQQMDDAAVVQEKLCEFCGVGRKVADCVALFSMRQQDAIPVDIHVWNIALRDYDSEGLLSQVKSLTPAVYKQVGDLFRLMFPSKAGWAHSLLFVAELPSFRPVLPDDMIQEMDNFRLQEQARKKEKKKSSSSA
jgi:N-glycosylase/DNA lyase